MDNRKPVKIVANRRQFLCDTFSVATSFTIGGAFAALTGRLAHGESQLSFKRKMVEEDLVEAIDETTGLGLLKLPRGFRYRSFGWTHDEMRGGSPTPPAHDGMGLVSEKNGVVTLVRNHEVNGTAVAIPIVGSSFDAKGGGGCTSLTFDTKQERWLESWSSLSGTVRNCAGGVTPGGNWLSCEETVVQNGDVRDNGSYDLDQVHGWIFEVPSAGQQRPEPLREMGRFSHEAIAVDRNTGVVYETEDNNNTSGFYRFIPNDRDRLAAGGRLQMMKVIGQDDLCGGVKEGAIFDVDWVDIADPMRAHSPNTSDESGVFYQGKSGGGTTFSRLEGCWFGNKRVYFDATSGGAAQVGQIWAFDPVEQKLQMIFESPGAEVLNMPDNLCVSPRGGILICEDSDYGKYAKQRIHGMDQEGHLSLFAVNNIQLTGQKNGFQGDFRNKEWCGASFSPDGEWLFVNIQVPGITFAITGPWKDTLF